MVPCTDRHRYITGQPALSVPVDEALADWHLDEVFSGKNPLPVAAENMPSTEFLWGSEGVCDRSWYLKDAGLISDEADPVFIASPARALADLIFKRLSMHQDLSTFSVDDVDMSDATKATLIRMLTTLMSQLPTKELRTWMSSQAILKNPLMQPA